MLHCLFDGLIGLWGVRKECGSSSMHKMGIQLFVCLLCSLGLLAFLGGKHYILSPPCCGWWDGGIRVFVWTLEVIVQYTNKVHLSKNRIDHAGSG